jgi:hypothetical protein
MTAKVKQNAPHRLIVEGRDDQWSIEDFLAVLVPPGDRCWPWAEQVTLKARAEYGAAFSTPDFTKARIHTWLAWQQEPGLPFGTAITAATFTHDATLATTFVKWMSQLYT